MSSVREAVCVCVCVRCDLACANLCDNTLCGLAVCVCVIQHVCCVPQMICACAKVNK